MSSSRRFNANRLSLALAVAAALGIGTFLAAPAHASTSWVNTATRAIPLPANSGAMPISPSQQIQVVVGLTPRNKSELDALVVAESTPGDPRFGETITPAQFLSDYGPTDANVQAVVSYLTNLGFSNIHTSGNNLAVSATGSATNVEAAFNTHLVSFVSADGRNVFVNTAPAQVPSSLGGIVSAVVGLQTWGVMHTDIVKRSPNPGPVQIPPSIPSPPQNPITTPPYSGPQYQIAYDAGKTPTGHNTTIGIVTAGVMTQVPKDLRQYEKEFDLPQVPYQIVPIGEQGSSTSGLDEWDLDSQLSSGIAEDLQKIVFYDAGGLADANLTPAFERIVSDDKVKAVNMSFGGCETFEYLDGAMLLDDIAYEQGAAEGMTFFAAAGDGGASCQLLVNAGQPGIVSAVEYPASSEYVVAVGGTSLFTQPGYTYDMETAWVSGGGGTSLWESPGHWTSGVIPPTNTEAGQRAVPDMAMVGDPNIGGADVVVNGQDEGVGGTSLSSPLTVGSWARMETAHNNELGFAAPILYKTFGQSFGTAAKDYHDIIVGDNYLYPALPGWDFTTGLGTFDISAVNAGLPTYFPGRGLPPPPPGSPPPPPPPGP